MCKLLILIIISIALLGGLSPVRAQTANAAARIPPSDQLCPMIQSAAEANRLPIAFFARLIWQESRFRPDEIGPMTRSGERALGIAQFMPGTAIERGLFEPFNPVEALPKSGAFLAELRDQFGNLGLAAAAYNAGPQRVRDYIAGLRDLPLETQNYVLSITGHPVEDWMKPSKDNGLQYVDQDETEASCAKVMALLNRPANSLIAEMELKVPTWCRYLEHPNFSVCGPVHERSITMNALRSGGSRIQLPPSGRGRAGALRSLHLTGLKY